MNTTVNFKQITAEFLYAELTRLAPQAGFQSTSEIAALLEIPPEQALGDLAFPCFRLSKALRKAPPLIAQDLAKQLETQGGVLKFLHKIVATGPYVNFFIDYAQVASNALQAALSGTLFQELAQRLEVKKLPRTMIEFSQPNTHKGFHVGHCRNVALGDALVRMNRYVGYDVVSANYIGDDGAHISKCLWYYKKYNQEMPPHTNKGEWLGKLYTAATQKLEDASEAERPQFLKEISAIQQAIEARESHTTALWKETRDWSMEDFYEIYNWLNVKFDHFFYESEVVEESKQIVEEGLKRGVFVRSEGAIGIDLSVESLGFCMVLKTDGTTLYATKDLALARRKFDQFKIGRSIYVVASEQELHFKQVFKVLEKMGFEQVKNCFHLPYALVILPEGKMSSRQGNVIYFSELRDKLLKHIYEEAYLEVDTSTWSDEEKSANAHKIAVAAIKYGMIASDPRKTIVFDMKQWLSFHGDTGPYLLYTNVRMKSILRKAGIDELSALQKNLLRSDIFMQPDEKTLLKRVLGFNETVLRAVSEHSPAIIANYLFELCQEFNTFYGKTSILKQDDESLKKTYLQLLAALSQVIEVGCNLLGIETVERM